jgi:hypothetical protein
LTRLTLRNAHLGDFLNVADGLETQLKFTESGHVTDVASWRRRNAGSSHTGKALAGKHVGGGRV